MYYFGMATTFACLSIASPALSDDNFPFMRSEKTIDFSVSGSEEVFQKLIDEVSDNSFVYLDWQFANFASNEVLGDLVPEGTNDDPTAAVCEQLDKSNEGVISLSGRPNKDFNHLLTTFELRRSEDDPFASVGCEFFNSDPGTGVRIRGFFYVTDYRIATADHFVFKSVNVDAATVPGKFFK